jgi:acetyl esterase/lipase
MLPCVQQHLASTAHTGGKVSLGGHSLGGSLATVLTLLLVHRGQVR